MTDTETPPATGYDPEDRLMTPAQFWGATILAFAIVIGVCISIGVNHAHQVKSSQLGNLTDSPAYQVVVGNTVPPSTRATLPPDVLTSVRNGTPYYAPDAASVVQTSPRHHFPLSRPTPP